jgi:hypothetical protein
MGTSALGGTTGNGNIALGNAAGDNLTTGGFNIAIGNSGVSTDGTSGSGSTGPTIRIGTSDLQTQTFIAGITGVSVTGAEVYVSASGQLGVNTSSQRYKTDIRDMGADSEAILALRPVSFRYRPEIDPKGTPQYGLVAEEVEKVSPDLVVRDAKGQAYTVRYSAVNAMLLNEFRKEHEKVEEQAKTIGGLQGQVAALTSRLSQVEALAARLDALEKSATGR